MSKVITWVFAVIKLALYAVLAGIVIKIYWLIFMFGWNLAY
jgi:hypothetical protein